MILSSAAGPSRRTCEAIIGHRPGEWRLEPVHCTQQIGLRTFVSASGLTHAGCSIEGHLAEVEHRYGSVRDMADVLERVL
jgi:hypothetical protein